MDPPTVRSRLCEAPPVRSWALAEHRAQKTLHDLIEAPPLSRRKRARLVGAEQQARIGEDVEQTAGAERTAFMDDKPVVLLLHLLGGAQMTQCKCDLSPERSGAEIKHEPGQANGIHTLTQTPGAVPPSW